MVMPSACMVALEGGWRAVARRRSRLGVRKRKWQGQPRLCLSASPQRQRRMLHGTRFAGQAWSRSSHVLHGFLHFENDVFVPQTSPMAIPSAHQTVRKARQANGSGDNSTGKRIVPCVHSLRHVAPSENSEVPVPDMTLLAPNALKSVERHTVDSICARIVIRPRGGRLMIDTVWMYNL